MFFNGQERKVTQAYNGKRGCMCGCKGNYAEAGTKAAAARVRKVVNFVGPMRPNSNDQAGYSTEAFMGVCHAYVMEGDRNTVVYFEA